MWPSRNGPPLVLVSTLLLLKVLASTVVNTVELKEFDPTSCNSIYSGPWNQKMVKVVYTSKGGATTETDKFKVTFSQCDNEEEFEHKAADIIMPSVFTFNKYHVLILRLAEMLLVAFCHAEGSNNKLSMFKYPKAQLGNDEPLHTMVLIEKEKFGLLTNSFFLPLDGLMTGLKPDQGKTEECSATVCPQYSSAALMQQVKADCLTAAYELQHCFYADGELQTFKMRNIVALDEKQIIGATNNKVDKLDILTKTAGDQCSQKIINPTWVGTGREYTYDLPIFNFPGDAKGTTSVLNSSTPFTTATNGSGSDSTSDLNGSDSVLSAMMDRAIKFAASFFVTFAMLSSGAIIAVCRYKLHKSYVNPYAADFCKFRCEEGDEFAPSSNTSVSSMDPDDSEYESWESSDSDGHGPPPPPIPPDGLPRDLRKSERERRFGKEKTTDAKTRMEGPAKDESKETLHVDVKTKETAPSTTKAPSVQQPAEGPEGGEETSVNPADPAPANPDRHSEATQSVEQPDKTQDETVEANPPPTNNTAEAPDVAPATDAPTQAQLVAPTAAPTQAPTQAPAAPMGTADQDYVPSEASTSDKEKKD